MRWLVNAFIFIASAAVSCFIVTMAGPLLLYYIGKHCRF